MEKKKPLLTLQQVSEQTDYSIWQLRHMLQKNEIPERYIAEHTKGGRWRFYLTILGYLVMPGQESETEKPVKPAKTIIGCGGCCGCRFDADLLTNKIIEGLRRQSNNEGNGDVITEILKAKAQIIAAMGSALAIETLFAFVDWDRFNEHIKSNIKQDEN